MAGANQRNGERQRNQTSEQAEQYRQASLRCFSVLRGDDKAVVVWAHYFENNNPAGHLNFVFVDVEGRSMIRESFNAGDWKRLQEVVDDSPVTERQTH